MDRLHEHEARAIGEEEIDGEERQRRGEKQIPAPRHEHERDDAQHREDAEHRGREDNIANDARRVQEFLRTHQRQADEEIIMNQPCNPEMIALKRFLRQAPRAARRRVDKLMRFQKALHANDIVLADRPAAFSLDKLADLVDRSRSPGVENVENVAADLKIAIADRIENHPAGRARRERRSLVDPKILPHGWQRRSLAHHRPSVWRNIMSGRRNR